MKRREFLIGAPLLLTACAGSRINLENLTEEDNKVFILFTIETTAVPIGYYAASNRDVDLALRGIYELAVNGTLTPEAINRILEALDTQDPLQIILIKRTLRLAELAGAKVEGGKIIGFANLDPDVIKAVAVGYVEGYDTWMIAHNRSSGLNWLKYGKKSAKIKLDSIK
jgi:hypothetical protein